MGKSSPSTPEPIDVVGQAQAQGAANAEAALMQGRLSNPRTETTPFGTMTNVIDPQGNIDRNITLNPAEQQNLELQRQLTASVGEGGIDLVSRIRDTMAPPIEDAYTGLPDFAADIDPSTFQRTTDVEGLQNVTRPGDFSADADRVRDAVFQQGSDLLNPVFDKRRERLETDLINKGFSEGAEGYSSSVGDFEQFERNPAMADLALRSIAAGGQEQSRLFGLDSAARAQLLGETAADNQIGQAEFGQSMNIATQQQNARNQLIQERLQQRANPLNELAVLMGSSPGVQTGQFSGLTPTPVQPTDLLGISALNQQGQQNEYNQRMSQRASQLGGVTNLAGSAMMAYALSSRTFKNTESKAEGILDKLIGIDVDRWRYKPEMELGEAAHIGPYAEDFKEAFGVGDGVTIGFMDAIGVLFAGMKEIAVEIREMKESM